jgi:GNAT superfamily N-acetyltransferase
VNSPTPLGKQKRAAFSCGVPALDRYLKEQAGQDVRNRVAAVFVLAEHDQVIGYYTLSATSVNATVLPDSLRKRLPQYAHMPAILLGRLAVDEQHRGKGLGGFLLVDALGRAFRLHQELGAIAVIVDAKDDNARAFYSHYEFSPLLDAPNRLFLSMRVIARVMDAAAPAAQAPGYEK